jgi:predicted LPLAT superfamily acyltransferase
MITSEKPAVDAKRAIRVKKRGNALGFWCFRMMFRVFGPKGTYLLLQLVATHYLIFDREAVVSTLSYIEKRFPRAGKIEKYWHVRRLFVNQGRQLIDRYVLARKSDYIKCHQVDTKETLETLQESDKGLVLLTSHIGNWQVALMHMGHLRKDITIVMRPEDNPAVRECLRLGSHEAKPVKMIDPQGHLGGALEIVQALNEGNIVCMMGDRSYGFDTLEVPFLGQPAYFPYGAFAVAAATESPVVALLTHKVSEREYIADVSNMWRPIYEDGQSKKEQLRGWLKNYIALLESFVEEHPYECFLFHNVWGSSKGSLR